MFKHLSKKRIITILASTVLPVLIIQAYVVAQPSSPPPGGNIDAIFNTVTSVNGIENQDTLDQQWAIFNSNAISPNPQHVMVSDDLSVSGNVGIGGTTPGSEELVVGKDLGEIYGDTTTLVVGDDNSSPVITIGKSDQNNGHLIWNNALNGLELRNTIGGVDVPGSIFLSSSGNVGLGTTYPSEKLVLGPDLGSVNTNTTFTINATGGSDAPGITLAESANDNARINWSNAYNALVLYTTLGGTANNSQLVLASDGDIGVGNVDPFAKLTVGTPTTTDTVESNSLAIATNDTTSPQLWIGKEPINHAEMEWDVTNGNLSFSTASTLFHPNQLTLDNNGNIGINAGDTIADSALLVKPYLASNIDEVIRAEYDTGNYASIGSQYYGMQAVGRTTGIDVDAKPLSSYAGSVIGLKSQVERTNINGDYYSGFFIDDNSVYGRLGNYHGLFADKLEVERGTNDDVDGYIASFTNTNNAYGGDGVAINLGTNAQGTPAHMIDFNHYDGTEIGSITKLGGTVSYNAFTGGHITKTPDNSTYEYGTIMSLKDVTSEEGSQQPQYYSEPTSSAYDNHIFGVYSSVYSEESKTHQVYAVGDGHVLVSTENGSIKAGDPITSSHLAGKGMKATDAGTVLGYALEDWDGSNTTRTETLANGTEVKVGLVAVYYYPGTYYAGNQQEQIDTLKQEIDELKALIKQ